MSSNGWIGVDLDGTIADYNGWQGELHIGAPIPLMVDRVIAWLNEGIEVRIFTARVSRNQGRADSTVDAIVTAIQDWTEEHVGSRLQVTCEKDYGMMSLWDDRCVQVERNTGRQIGEA